MFLPVLPVPGLELGMVPEPELVPELVLEPEPEREPELVLVLVLAPVLELVPRRQQASSRRLTMPVG